jgi:hypothetical protein
LLHLN